MKYKENQYKWEVRRYFKNGNGTTTHSKHMTKKAAENKKKLAQNQGFKVYIRKLQ